MALSGPGRLNGPFLSHPVRIVTTMNTITTMQPHDDVAAALENLAEAFDFTIVARCPDPGCVGCNGTPLADAA